MNAECRKSEVGARPEWDLLEASAVKELVSRLVRSRQVGKIPSRDGMVRGLVEWKEMGDPEDYFRREVDVYREAGWERPAGPVATEAAVYAYVIAGFLQQWNGVAGVEEFFANEAINEVARSGSWPALEEAVEGLFVQDRETFERLLCVEFEEQSKAVRLRKLVDEEIKRIREEEEKE